MLCMFSWLPLFTDQRSSLNLPVVQLKSILWLEAVGVKFFGCHWAVRPEIMPAAPWLCTRTPVLFQKETRESWTQVWGWEERAPQATFRAWTSHNPGGGQAAGGAPVLASPSPGFCSAEGYHLPGLKLPLESSYLQGFAKLGEREYERKMETGGYRCLWQILLNRAVPIIGNLSPDGLRKVYNRICCLNCRCHYLFLMFLPQQMEKEL